MSDSASESGRPPIVCRMLRTKTAFGTLVCDSTEAMPWQTGASTTAVYWCLRTMQNVGPDDHFAHPHACDKHRECFVHPFD